MKFIDEYRDPVLVKGLLAGISARMDKLGRPVALMEVCGSHTNAIGRYGIRGLLPADIRLISGPGCPVCVTCARDVDIALYLAQQSGIIFCSFGDMLKVPGGHGGSLQEIRAAGGDVRVVASATECLPLARDNPKRQVVFMGIGFETTSPTVAAVVRDGRRRDIENFSVFSVHKVIPPALKALMDDPALNIDGFICPGHVSTITGPDAFAAIPRNNKAAVITGFEPVDILEGIFMLLGQMVSGDKKVEIQYRRGVSPEGNPRAREIMAAVFQPGPSEWRGLGEIPASGLAFQEEYDRFDALRRFGLPEMEAIEVEGCACGDILRGIKSPPQCLLFKKICKPSNPVGPCMVSAEGSCAAYFKYHL